MTDKKKAAQDIRELVVAIGGFLEASDNMTFEVAEDGKSVFVCDGENGYTVTVKREF